MIDPKGLASAGELLEVTQLLRQYPNPAKLQAHLNDGSVAWNDGQGLIAVLQTAVNEETERLRQEEETRAIDEAIAKLGGPAKVGELVGDASKFDRDEQLVILNRAADFAGLSGPATLRQFGVDPSLLTVEELLQFLKTAKQINDLGGTAKLAELGITERVDNSNAGAALQFLQQALAPAAAPAPDPLRAVNVNEDVPEAQPDELLQDAPEGEEEPRQETPQGESAPRNLYEETASHSIFGDFPPAQEEVLQDAPEDEEEPRQETPQGESAPRNPDVETASASSIVDDDDDYDSEDED
jgi:hypothetical protein